MKPKGKLLALITVFAAIGLVTATGAFTTVQAERTVDVSAAQDSDALLQLEPANSNNADEYVTGGNGVDTVSVSLETTNGQGVNVDANTTIDSLITITNQGSQSVGVYVVLNHSSSDLSEVILNSVFEVRVNNATDSNHIGENIVGDGNAVSVGVGEYIEIGFIIDLTGVNSVTDSDTILETIEVHADAELG